ncbi:heat shock protein, putative [Trypanosoma cruzi marinkellei]|uniref:Heat shock protein, putative n=1 Tax=Trypanosoma cruzi marinkellei TaxID=85056 RepID=K2M7Y6_TRYCR|nr:heat shock protein, putative [Trypanosoma cruzi marinkellei]
MSSGMAFRLVSSTSLLVALAPKATTVTTARLLHMTRLVRRDVGRGNFFAYLGFPQTPELDAAEVQRAYHELQRRVHPDQANVQAKEVEEGQQESKTGPAPVLGKEDLGAAGGVADVDESIYANASYETLRDPFLRCRYLMRLSRAEKVKGAPLTTAEEEALMHDDDRRSVEENRKLMGDAVDLASLEPDFLSELMGVNETIFSTDLSQEEGVAKLRLLVAHLEERYEEFYSQAKEYWKLKDTRRFYHSVLGWTYVRNALKHARDRLD